VRRRAAGGGGDCGGAVSGAAAANRLWQRQPVSSVTVGGDRGRPRDVGGDRGRRGDGRGGREREAGGRRARFRLQRCCPELTFPSRYLIRTAYSLQITYVNFD